MLTRAECLQILELGAAANEYEIETRYAMLIKRYRGRTDDVALAELERITLAYNTLTGRVVEPEPEKPTDSQVVLGRTRKQWRNIWHYGRIPFLIGLIVLGFGIYFIYSVATNEPPDFQVVAAGRLFTLDDMDRVKAYVRDTDPALQNVSTQIILLELPTPEPSTAQGTGAQTTSASDTLQIPGVGSENHMYAMMKMMVTLAGDKVDLFILDRGSYDQYAPQGAFQPIDNLLGQLADLPADVRAKVKPLRRQAKDTEATTDLENPPPKPSEEEYAQMDADTSLPVTGLEITGLESVQGLGVYGQSLIVAVGVRSEKPEVAQKLIVRMIREHETLAEARRTFESRYIASQQSAQR